MAEPRVRGKRPPYNIEGRLATEWIVASSIGMALGMAAFSLVAGSELSANPGAVVAGFVTGAIAGLAQWLILRRRVPRTFLWIVACSVGIGLANLLSNVGIAAEIDGPLDIFTKVGSTAGIFVGVLEAVLLLFLKARGQKIAWWVLASAIGSPFAAWLAILFTATLAAVTSLSRGISDAPGIQLWLILGAFTGAIYGAVTVIVLQAFMPQPAPAHSS